jgi:NCAIR mutase (PurE)-related protein
MDREIPTADLGDVQLDLDRARRCGHAEVVFGEGKTAETLIKIFERTAAEKIDTLATRVDAEKAQRVCQQFASARYNPVARTLRLPIAATPQKPTGHIAVVTAGTADQPVALEACETLDWMGVGFTRFEDIGVAGPQRLVQRLPELRKADAIVVVAGMEGALPSVVGGYVAAPIIAVPTSVGYGASFGGVAALLTMLNTCAANVAVVNIDAGFKGGYMAGLIARAAHAPK